MTLRANLRRQRSREQYIDRAALGDMSWPHSRTRADFKVSSRGAQVLRVRDSSFWWYPDTQEDMSDQAQVAVLLVGSSRKQGAAIADVISW